MPYTDPEKAKECAARYRKSPRGRASMRRRNKAYRSNPENQEKIKRDAAEYRKSEAGRIAYFKGRLKKYNLTIEDYNGLFKKQNGVCAFCGEPPRSLPLDVEHDHKCCEGPFSCGLCIRGLVHRRCNTFIGTIENCLNSYKKYVERHKASLGKREL